VTAENLDQMIQEADGDVVGMLRNAPIGTFAFPYKPEYSNWRDEQEAWAATAVLFDQSTHMTDVSLKLDRTIVQHTLQDLLGRPVAQPVQVEGGLISVRPTAGRGAGCS
jgi:hypothetical protein